MSPSESRPALSNRTAPKENNSTPVQDTSVSALVPSGQAAIPSTAIYGDNALTYLRAGWSVIPLPRGEKSPPPSGRTGWEGRNFNREEIEREAIENPHGNIAIRIPNGVVGIDVDDYDDKPGAATLAELVAECGELPDTVMSTSREGTDSGIRFFRVPRDMVFVEGLPGIEILQPHHRYAVVWPSIHGKTGRAYQWLNTRDRSHSYGVPRLANIPELPATWVERLKVATDSKSGNHSKSNLTGEEGSKRYAEWVRSGEMCSHMRDALDKPDASNGSRHDSCRKAVLSIIRLGESGHSGAREALAELHGWFDAALNGDRDTSGEWDRMVIGAMNFVDAQPTPEREKGCRDNYPETEDEDSGTETDDDDTGTDDDDADPGKNRDGKQRVNVSNKARASRWVREEIGRHGLAGLFHRSGELVFTPRVGEKGYVPRENENEDDGPAQVRVMSETELKTMVESRYDPGAGRTREKETDETDAETGEPKKTTVKEWEPKPFPRESATHGYSAARMREDTPNLRTLTGVTHTPIMRPDGTVLDTPGYDSKTRLLFLPDAGLTVPAVSSEPTPAEIKEAVELIAGIVEQFPFVEEHHRANWYGALFTPVMRTMLPPPYPMFVVDAPDKGSGKSYLASIIRTIHGGILRAGWPSDDGEMTKGVLGILMETTAPIITFDNVRGKIKSEVFEALLTSPTFSGRILGVNRNGSAPNDRLWMVTANNAEIGGDLARRTYWVTIDPRVPRPFERTGFRLDLPTWIPANRGRIIHAMLTIVRGWTLAGSPNAPRKRSDDYAAWDAAIEGLLSWAGFSGQFGKPDPKHMESTDDQEWETFLTAVFEVMGEKPFKMPELVARLDTIGMVTDGPEGRIDPALLPGDLADKWARSTAKSGFTKSLSVWFKHREGRYVGPESLTVKVRIDAKRGNTFRIEPWQPS